MTVCGVVAEYNPFHAGHAHHLAETRRRLGADTAIVCAMSGNFVQRGDLAVLEKYRRRGIGTALMDCAEKIAGTFADTVYLAVGLHDGYGSAQRMYCKRGYLPDGSGVWYQNAPAEAYGQVCNDDDLNLYFSKRLR